MQTLFDIGDEIEITLRGKIKNYSVSEDGDCYTLLIRLGHDDETCVYLDTEAMKEGKARLIKAKNPEILEPIEFRHEREKTW